MGALAMMNLQIGNENDVETYVYAAKECNDTGESMLSQSDWPVLQRPGSGSALPRGNSKCTIYCSRV
jgi:hypothetical protein